MSKSSLSVSIRMDPKTRCAVDHSWCNSLPKKLGEGRSAWLSRSSRAIFLRPRYYAQKSVRFVLSAPINSLGDWTGTGINLFDVHCFDVPEALKVA